MGAASATPTKRSRETRARNQAGDPLTDRDFSLRYLAGGDMEDFLRGEDLGDSSLRDPEELSEVLS